MRTGALTALLLVTACNQGDRDANQAADRGPSPSANAPTAAPAIVIAATGCAATWDGQAVTPAQITARTAALFERAIDAIGGRQNITMDNLPVPSVEAPADLDMACADTILSALRNAGAFTVTVRPAGGRAPVPLDFPLDTGAPPPIPTVLGLGAGGQISWNADPLDAAGLARQLGQIGGSTSPVDPAEGAPPPGGLELRVTREATFGQLYDLLAVVNRHRLRPFVYLPSAEPGAAPVAAAAPSAGGPPIPPVPPPSR